MPPRRTTDRAGHARSISLLDENATVNSLAGPQRSKAALGAKPRVIAAGIPTSASKDNAGHKTSSSVGGYCAPGRRILGDLSNAAKSLAESKDAKPASRLAKVRKATSQTSLHPSESSTRVKLSVEAPPAATYGGNTGKKIVAALRNRGSAQSLNTTGPNHKRKTSSKPSSSSSNPWATAAPKVLREEIHEVEVIADHGDHIEIDDLDQGHYDFGDRHQDFHGLEDEKMVLDSADERVDAESSASTSEQENYENEELLDPHYQHHLMQSDENELSLCTNNVDDSSNESYGSSNWLMLSPEEDLEAKEIIATIRREFKEEINRDDQTLVVDYQEEIFEYMEQLELTTMPNPRYMESQSEIEWEMRTTLIDWLLQVHMRYHMLPETLWIAVNIIDRFLSKRVVSLVKFQLVGVTAMFVAAKYEEIMAPSVEEFVYMTENGYTRDEILKGEKILLSTLDFRISSYCSPYSWLRRISKADDYDVQTRTLSKFLIELTLLDHRFLRAKSSLIAAIGMYTARRLLGADWGEAFIFHSGYTESQLIAPMTFLIDAILSEGFQDRFVFKKYANRKFLKASIFARNQAPRVREESIEFF